MSGWVDEWMSWWVFEWMSGWVGGCLSEWVIRTDRERLSRIATWTSPWYLYRQQYGQREHEHPHRRTENTPVHIITLRHRLSLCLNKTRFLIKGRRSIKVTKVDFWLRIFPYKSAYLFIKLAIFINVIPSTSSKYTSPVVSCTPSRNHKPRDRARFEGALQTTSWETLFRLPTCEEQLNFFNSTIRTLLDVHLPERQITRCSDHRPWVDDNFAI